jgi:FKBP-type peptidyl-prolyl cis-trans isomerase
VVLHLAGQLPARWESHTKPAAPAEVFVDRREQAVTLGANHLPPSLEAAVSSMRPGERASVFCASPCAMGPAIALPELPPGAPHGVEWTVELVDIVQVRDMYGDGSLVKRRTRVGTGDFPVDCPLHDCTVRIQLTTAALLPTGLQQLDRPADAPQTLEFELGTGAQPPGLESCIRLMVPGEKAQVVAAPRHGYEATPPGSWATPPGLKTGSSVQWVVTLVGFDAPVNWHQAEVPDILADAARAKEAGVALFKQQHWALARSRFEAVAGKLGGLRGLSAEEEVQATRLRVSCLLNAAAAAQREGEHAAAVAHCSTVLAKLDAGSAKAMYRRGVSHIALGNWEQASADLEGSAAADPEAAPDCDKQLARLRVAQRDAAAGIKTQLGGWLTAT